MASGLRKTDVGPSGHSYPESEKLAYVDFINTSLGESNLEMVPVSEEGEKVFEACSSGVVIPHLIHAAFPDEMDLNKIVSSPKNKFEANQNHDATIAAAKALGCSVVNIGGEDLYKGTPHLVMGILWQVIKKTLMSQVFLNTDLGRLASGDETVETIQGAPPEQLLLRWFNYHLDHAGHHRKATNFTSDLQDSELFVTLMSQIAPDKISESDLADAYREKDPLKRAEIVIEWAERLGCKKFVTAQTIVDGNPRLNLAFVATLFNKYPSLGETEAEKASKKAKALEDQLMDLEGLLDDTKLDLDTITNELEETKAEKEETASQLLDATQKLSEALENALKLSEDKEKALSAKSEAEEQVKVVTGQLEQALEEKDDLFSQLEAEINQKLEFENKLSNAREEVESLQKKQKQDELDWLNKLEEEIGQKEMVTTELEATKKELEETRTKSAQEVEDLFSKLEEEIDEKEKLNVELESARKAIEDAKVEKQRTEEEWEAQLEKTLVELEESKIMAADTESKLTAELEKEKAERAAVEQKLSDTEKALEQTIQETDDEKLALLKRIEELEKELREARQEIADKTEAWAKEKEQLLADAAADKASALEEAERDKDEALEKVRMLLAGSQKQGSLRILSNNLVGLQTWKERFFVLREGYLCFYKDEKSAAKQKPLHMIDCETTRLYELEEEEVKKPHCFQIDTGQTQFNVQCESANDLRQWMTEIRVAKKKKLGVKVVSEETSEQRKKREAASSSKTPRGKK